jgi:hypothetical protein
VRGLRIGAVALAVLVFALQDQPSGTTILVIAALLLLVLAGIEILGRPESPAVVQAESPETEPEAPRPAVAVPATGSASDVAPPPRPPT